MCADHVLNMIITFNYAMSTGCIYLDMSDRCLMAVKSPCLYDKSCSFWIRLHKKKDLNEALTARLDKVMNWLPHFKYKTLHQTMEQLTAISIL